MSAPDTTQMFTVFGRIGLMSFGGPAAQIALMHKELVEDRPWLSEDEYLRALSFCMLLPGPEAMQLATYSGWKMHGVRGGLIAGLLFVVPGAVIIAALAALYVTYGTLPVAQGVLLGIKAAVLVIVLQALLRISRKALISGWHWAVAGAAFAGIFLFALPFPLIIALAATFGWVSANRRGIAPGVPTPLPPIRATLQTAALWGALWLAPLVLLGVMDLPFLAELGTFFAKVAIVTFGGAYAVLAYMTQEVVVGFNWIETHEMVDALGLAETTPGPLILVTEFVGFLAGHRTGGWSMAIAATLVTLWATFVPCFLWIFCGAPYMNWIAGQPRLASALQMVTAAVVGVVLNLTIWFTLHVWFSDLAILSWGAVSLPWPAWSTVQPAALGLSALAGALLLAARWPLWQVLIAMMIAGWIISVTGL